MGMYVPLWVKSHYSFLEGASHPSELVAEARSLGLPALALTDRDGVHGIVRAYVEAREVGQKLITGSQVTVTTHLPRTGELTTADVAAVRTETPLLLAMNRMGYGNLCRLISIGRRRCQKGASLVTWEEVAAHAEGLILLCHDAGTDSGSGSGPGSGSGSGPHSAESAGLSGPFGHAGPLGSGSGFKLLTYDLSPITSQDPLAALADAFAGRAYGLVTRHRCAQDVQHERNLRNRMKALGWPLVAGTEVLYHAPARRPLQDVLTCIRHGVALHTAGDRLQPNAEHALLPPDAFARLFEDDPSLVTRTLEIANQCTFSLADLRYVYPAERLPDGTTQHDWLRQLVHDGALGRYQGQIPEDVQTQIDKELQLIGTLEYDGYFLGMWDIVQFCKSQAILCQGRGSAANSVVCYCLGITAIDPVRMGLLFERFISLERAEPPDIDLDIEHERREEVIQHVYGKFGRRHAAMVANVIRYRTRSAIRDVGKALGIAETALDRLSRLAPHYHDGVDPATLQLAGLDPEAPAHRLLMRLTQEIQDFPRHLSVHPGGFLLGHEPVDTLVPVENATMQDRTVIQWDKNDVEALALFKVDLLGLGMLSQVHRCFDLLRQHHGIELGMATVPPEDPMTYEMIGRGDTVGVFQIESRAQMSMLPRMKPKTFYDLVIEVAIIRPGPITGGMVHPYLRRRDGTEEVDYPHPSLIPVLQKTLGIPLFQEQVMKLAIVAADYTPGEADRLRRDMAAWRKCGRIEAHHDRLVTRMAAKGIDIAFAERVFDQIRGFGEYGFPESHAASFALISYVTAWLKCHHPVEFTCALLNAWPMGFYTPATLVEDARRHGVEVLPLDVVESDWECKLEALDPTGRGGLPRPPAFTHADRHGSLSLPAFAIRMGLRFVKGLSTVHRTKLAAAPPPYQDLDDFVRRTQLDRAALDALAEAGAFESLGLQRREALWQTRAAAERSQETLDLTRRENLPLFVQLSGHEEVLWDYRRASHSPRGHPLSHLRADLQRMRLPTAAEVQRMPNRRQVRYAGLVICRQRPGTAKGVTFFTLEDETGFVNLVLWRETYERFRLLAKTAILLGVTGKVQRESGVTHIVVEALWPVTLDKPVERIPSRDFH